MLASAVAFSIGAPIASTAKRRPLDLATTATREPSGIPPGSLTAREKRAALVQWR